MIHSNSYLKPTLILNLGDLQLDRSEDMAIQLAYFPTAKGRHSAMQPIKGFKIKIHFKSYEIL